MPLPLVPCPMKRPPIRPGQWFRRHADATPPFETPHCPPPASAPVAVAFKAGSRPSRTLAAALPPPFPPGPWRLPALRAAATCLLLASFCGLSAFAQTPEWIWRHANPAGAGDTAFFRREFNVGFQPSFARITAVGDDAIAVHLNGREVARAVDWKKPVVIDVTADVRSGPNLLAVRGHNAAAGAAAVLVKLEIRSPNNSALFVVTDTTWTASPGETPGWQTPGFSASDWKPAVSLGLLGAAPWGNVLGVPQATPAESLVVPPGFKAELLKSADATEGSWICMAIDDQGRFVVSPEKEEVPLLRITLGADGRVARTERLDTPIRAAMGLLWAHDSLYVNGRGPKGVGLYRLVDANHDDRFGADEVHLLKNFEGDNEHGYHAVRLGPDQSLWVMNGNHTKVPPGIAPDSPLQNFAEDLLLPRLWDPNGHAKGILAPGGHLLKTDPDGRRWELFCGGFRNAYDFDFDRDGEAFTFDSDMEWDVGAPWYRPTRIDHCVSGGEYGWRSGSGKWPVHYPDSLPGNLDIGLSSPTGVRFGTRSNFPPRYRDALFACDWNYGKIFAVHLRPEGSSYTGSFETFVAGKPLAVTSLEFGRDGAMYFVIGGWKLQSGLYRVRYDGPRVAEPIVGPAEAAERRIAAEQRALRRRLEAFHGKKDPAATDVAWPHLGSPDRWVRFAARVAVESQEVALWQRRALDETRVDASINALLALARTADKPAQPALLAALGRLADQTLTGPQSLDALRVLQVCLARMGRPDPRACDAIVAALSPVYPAKSADMNRELSQLLVFLDAPDAVAKTLAWMASAPTQEEQMHGAHVLRTARSGWTPERRRTYFSWFNHALRDFKGGNSFDKYLVAIRRDALAQLDEQQRADVASIVENRAAVPPPAAPPRAFVREWTLAALEPDLSAVGRGRSFARGKEAFEAARCLACHRLGTAGGSIGPDLTGIAGRFARRDILESILVPSKVISDRYQTFVVTTRDGEDIGGTVAEETEQTLVLVVDPLTQRRQEIAKTDIRTRSISKLSQMPEALLDTLAKDEILDLLAYLEADGKPDAAVSRAK